MPEALHFRGPVREAGAQVPDSTVNRPTWSSQPAGP